MVRAAVTLAPSVMTALDQYGWGHPRGCSYRGVNKPLASQPIDNREPASQPNLASEPARQPTGRLSIACKMNSQPTK